MFLIRQLVAAIATLTISVAAVPAGGQPRPRVTVMTCTNPASGAAWQISIDYEGPAVDSNPAKVSDAEISWHDARDNGNYTFDRKSGDLTVIVPSSTGGYFLHDHCEPPP